MLVQAYVFFEGRAEEAAQFYHEAIGAEVAFMMRYKESPDSNDPNKTNPAMADKVMHMSLRIGDTEIMGSDGNCQGAPKFQGMALSLTVDDSASAEKKFAALAKDGQVLMPLTKTFFSPSFGMVSDRFGMMWMVMVEAK